MCRRTVGQTDKWAQRYCGGLKALFVQILIPDAPKIKSEVLFNITYL
jgi:hypothetical protein